MTTDEKLARALPAEIEHQLQGLSTAAIARQAWDDCGAIVLCDTDEEMVAEADRMAVEHVQVMDARSRLFFCAIFPITARCFLGQMTNVSYGDKVIGTNHTPCPRAATPASPAACGSANSSKPALISRVKTAQASVELGEYCSRLCALEGFAGHKEQADIRLRRHGGQTIRGLEQLP